MLSSWFEGMSYLSTFFWGIGVPLFLYLIFTTNWGEVWEKFMITLLSSEFDWHQHEVDHRFVTNHHVSRRLPSGDPAKCLPFTSIPEVTGRECRYFMEKFKHPQYLHKYAAVQHHTKGTLFRDYLGEKGPGLLFTADPTHVRSIQKASGECPSHIVPPAWNLYLRITNRKRGLFFMDGEEWKNCRRILNKYLVKPSVIKPVFPLMGANTNRLMEDFYRAHSSNVFEQCLMYSLHDWSLEITSHVLIGSGFDVLRSTVIEGKSAFKLLVRSIHGMFEDTAAMGSNSPQQEMEKNTPNWQGFCDHCNTALDTLTEYTMKALNKKKSEGLTNDGSLMEDLMKESMEDQLIVRLLVDLYLAGADTTAWTAVWILYALSENSTVVEDAHKEVQELLTSKGKDLLSLEQEDLKDLPFCRNVIKEALRMYPVAPFLTRGLDKDCVIGAYKVPEQTMTIVSLYSIGRDPKYFLKPGIFYPKRWTKTPTEGGAPEEAVPDNPDSSQLANLPWGIGKRSCIGRIIAENLLTVMIAHVVTNFKLRNYNSNMHLKMEMISVTSQQLELVLEKRNDPST